MKRCLSMKFMLTESKRPGKSPWTRTSVEKMLTILTTTESERWPSIGSVIPRKKCGMKKITNINQKLTDLKQMNHSVVMKSGGIIWKRLNMKIKWISLDMMVRLSVLRRQLGEKALDLVLHIMEDRLKSHFGIIDTHS